MPIFLKDGGVRGSEELPFLAQLLTESRARLAENTGVRLSERQGDELARGLGEKVDGQDGVRWGLNHLCVVVKPMFNPLLDLLAVRMKG